MKKTPHDLCSVSSLYIELLFQLFKKALPFSIIFLVQRILKGFQQIFLLLRQIFRNFNIYLYILI